MKTLPSARLRSLAMSPHPAVPATEQEIWQMAFELLERRLLDDTVDERPPRDRDDE